MVRQRISMREGLPLLFLCALSLGVATGFAHLGLEVREPGTTYADQQLVGRVADMTRSWPLTLSETVSLFGTAPLVAVVTAIVGASLGRNGCWAEIVLLIAAVVGAVLLSPLTKHLVGRSRPTAFFRTSATGYSFPSGHTLNATCLALALGFILWYLPWHHEMKVAWTLVLAFSVASVGASRVVLGVHYPTDVLGGFLLGAAWVALLAAVSRGLDLYHGSPRSPER
jgi:undecaprenyl-diphosphatase